MLAKLTSKNQLTLPKAVVDAFPGVDYYQVDTKDGAIMLKPVNTQGAEDVRQKLAALDIQPSDVVDAIKWARS